MERKNSDQSRSSSGGSLRVPSIFEKPSYLGVIPVVFLYFLVVMGLSPLTDQIIIEVVCDDLNESDCGSTTVAAASADLSFAAGMAMYGPAVLLCGFYGSLADKLGRKAVMSVTIIGLLLDVCLQFYVSEYKPASYKILIILANFIYGLSGGFITFIMSSMCYVSDATIAVPHTRHSAYSYTETAIFAPQIIGPVATGFWAAAYGFSMPLVASAFLLVGTFIYLLFLPESLPPSAECRQRPVYVDLFKTFKNMAYLFSYQCAEGRSPIPLIAGSFFVVFTAVMGATAVRVIYFKHTFEFDASQIGVYAGVEGFVACLSMLFAPAILALIVGVQLELVTVIQIGYAFRMVHFAVFGFVRTELQVYSALALLLLTGPVAPYSRTILSNSVPVVEQAKIFSAFSALEVLAVLLGAAFNPLFAMLLRQSVGWLIFEVFAVLGAVSLGMISYLRSCPDLNDNLPSCFDKKRGVSVASSYSTGNPSPFVLLDGHGDDTEAHGDAEDITFAAGIGTGSDVRTSLLENENASREY